MKKFTTFLAIGICLLLLISTNTKLKAESPVPTGISTFYNSLTNTLYVTVDWIWAFNPNSKKTVVVAIFADLNGDGLCPNTLEDPTTWEASTTSGDGTGIDMNPLDEFLGQFESATIKGFTETGDNTDTGIGHHAIHLAGADPAGILLCPYDLETQDQQGETGSFTLTYTNVTMQPTIVCAVLYDIHIGTAGVFVEPLSGGTYNVINGVIDFDGNGTILEASDDVPDFELQGYELISGLLDISGNGSIGVDDDISDNSFNGAFNVFDGRVDIDDDGDVDSDDDGLLGDHAISSLTGRHGFISVGTDYNEDNSMEGNGAMDCLVSGTNTNLPVEFVSLTAVAHESSIELLWELASETGNEGFEIERSLNGYEFESIGWVEGQGTTSEYHYYTFVDDKAPTGVTLYYRLKQIDYNGNFEYLSTVVSRLGANTEISIYPNPANDYLMIIGNDIERIDIYTVQGRKVETTIPLNNRVNIDDLNPGIYYLRIYSNNQVTSKHVVVK